MTVLLVTAAVLVSMAALGASGTRRLPNPTPGNSGLEALLIEEAPAWGLSESMRAVGGSLLLLLVALPFVGAGLVLYAAG